MAGPSDSEEPWCAWPVAPGSGFEVNDPKGIVGLVQTDPKQFRVTRPFRFTDGTVQKMLVDRLLRDGMTQEEALTAVEDARTFTPRDENPTDLASIPRYMRWFESSYGLHTLAAIIHDDLIVDKPNDGALKNDTLSDRFFRAMMKSAGVPWLKRWIMWAAVALRSRWAVGGLRRASVVTWLVLAVVGMGSFGWFIGSWLLDWSHPGSAWQLLAVALLLPFAAAPLWGKQYGAGLVAAIAGLWILPPALFAGAGYVVYLAIENGLKAAGSKRAAGRHRTVDMSR